VKKNDMGGACGTWGGGGGGGGNVCAWLWWGNLRDRGHMEDLGVYRRIILQLIINNWGGGMDWISVTQDRDRRRVLVNAVVSIGVP
jgi:hypothetical protein